MLTVTAGDAELHVADAVRFSVPPSVYNPVAVSCTFVPSAIEGLAGVTEMETRAGAPTVRVVEPDTAPCAARIVAVPWASPFVVARPVLLMAAVAGFEELHVTLWVRFWVLLSVNVPVAVNCCAVPSGTLAAAGVTAMETSAGGPTVSPVELEMAPWLI